MAEHPTEQEVFWQGSFGDEYLRRNEGPALVAQKTAHLARALAHAAPIQSVLEFGCNTGLNLLALRQLLPEAELHGVEINRSAASIARERGFSVEDGSILGYAAERSYDLVLSSGLLIHIEPEQLPEAYRAIHAACGHYLCLREYYNPTPVEVPYRGHRNRLFKRDWAGELLDGFPSLTLLDYGFHYHRDPQFPADDVTWFLLERR
jgi:spore coat polysaccharide biosynthesis protein SpsF